MRAVLTIALIGLMLLAVPISFAHAQDYYELYKPTMIPPSISVSSPLNYSSISANFVQMIFNVSEPQITKLSPNIPPSIIENNGVRNSTNIAKVSYKGDWQIEEQILYSNEDDSHFLEFNVTLSDIPKGNHEVKITAISTVRLIVAMFGFDYHPNSTSSINFAVNFAVNSSEPSNQDTDSPSIMVSQIVLVLLLVVALVVVAILAAQRRRDKKRLHVSKVSSFSAFTFWF